MMSNMKRIVLLLMAGLVLTVPSYSLADETIKFDGYMWEELPLDLRTLYLTGYLSGFSYGSVSGSVNSLTGLKSSIISFESEQYFKKIEGLYKMELAASLFRVDLMFEKNTDFYIKEIESFYKTYPLCKSLHFDVLLTKLADIWRNKNIIKGRVTYKDVGEECLNPNKK